MRKMKAPTKRSLFLPLMTLMPIAVLLRSLLEHYNPDNELKCLPFSLRLPVVVSWLRKVPNFLSERGFALSYNDLSLSRFSKKEYIYINIKILP